MNIKLIMCCAFLLYSSQMISSAAETLVLCSNKSTQNVLVRLATRVKGTIPTKGLFELYPGTYIGLPHTQKKVVHIITANHMHSFTLQQPLPKNGQLHITATEAEICLRVRGVRKNGTIVVLEEHKSIPEQPEEQTNTPAQAYYRFNPTSTADRQGGHIISEV